MVPQTKILVVDDDPAILRLLELVLQDAHYSVFTTTSGKSVPDLIQEIQPALIMLDIELPDSSGIDLVKTIRQLTSAPVIMVSGKNSDLEIITCFNSGADDFVVKPFSVAELVARVQAVLRRSYTRPSPPYPLALDGSPIFLEEQQRRAFVGSLEISLTQKEFHLLQLFMKQSGKVLSRETILDKIWGINNLNIQTRAVDACISRLRKKVRTALGQDIIEAIPGFGYRLQLQAINNNLLSPSL